jgi:hypothetical protein
LGANKDIKTAYLHGVFYGRLSKDEGSYNEGKPSGRDFDVSDKLEKNTFWINMGMIVEMLNYFTTLPGVGSSKPMFEVDITSTIIGGHPNLISCDRRVLIPNYQAPKYQWGEVGVQNYWDKAKSDPNAFASYYAQYRVGEEVSDGDRKLADDIIGKMLFQHAIAPGKVFRNNLDKWINWFRYNRQANGNSYSFPSKQDVTIKTFDGREIQVDKDRGGLLSNIYISYDAFESIITSTSVDSYNDIYKAIFDVLMKASDDFWDLALTEGEGTLTIVDRKYISKSNIDQQDGDPVWSFDYYDADSLIKSFKFRPALTDAQATRAIFGSTNNPTAKYSYDDKNDILVYQFKDAVIIPSPTDPSQGSRSAADDELTYFTQLRAMVGELQKIDDNDNSIQMSVNPYVPPLGVMPKDYVPGQTKEVIKLVMPDHEMLRAILHDGDKKNNQIYCAVQPGITAELTMLGIGGLRTFQYFLVRNLPEPYSHRNVVLRVTDVHQTLEAGNWETTIRAGLIPLTDYVKDRIGYPKHEKTV